MLIRIFFLVMLLLILFALFWALYSMVYQRRQPEKMVMALTVRIGLSLVLFLSMLAMIYWGWI